MVSFSNTLQMPITYKKFNTTHQIHYVYLQVHYVYLQIHYVYLQVVSLEFLIRYSLS